MKYIFWYKKEIEANNPRDAVKKEEKKKSKFCSMEIVDCEEETDAIGFCIGDDV